MNFSTLLGMNGLSPALSLLSVNALSPNLNLGINFPASALLNQLKPTYDQSGPVFNGPGSLHRHLPFALPKLDRYQKEALDRAKRYATEESFKAVLAKQALQHQLLLQQQPLAAKKAQTLTLLSRLYVGSISYDLNETNIRQAFQPFGPIKTVTMSWDAATQKHKGFAFIEFELPESALLAVEQMNGASLGGRQLKVGRPSNLPQADSLIDELVTEFKAQRKVYVSGVHPDLSEEDLSLVFEAFGKIVSCKLQTDAAKGNKHRNFGYIEYDTEQSANDAVASMNMFDLGGQYLRVCKAIAPPEDAQPASTTLPDSNGSKTRSPVSADQNPGHTETEESEQPGNLDASFIDNDDVDGGTLENQENFHIRGSEARFRMMQKLIRPPTKGILILRNMVGPDDCDDELEGEVKEECSNYGSVERVIIYQELDETGELIIKIFVVFADAESLSQAIAALNGRFFAGRKIIAERYDLNKFEANDLTG